MAGKSVSTLASSTPHIYDLGMAVKPGKHRLTLQIDNRMIINVGPNAHSMTDHTQGNWNGVVGKIELEPRSPVWLDAIQVYPDLARQVVRIELNIHNALGIPGAGILEIIGCSNNTDHPEHIPSQQIDFQLAHETTSLEVDIHLGENAEHWDEFSLALYNLELALDAKFEEKSYIDSRHVTFGMRGIKPKELNSPLMDRQPSCEGR